MKLLFPSVIHELEVKNFKFIKKELVDFVYKAREEDSYGVQYSNQGGWQSEPEYCNFDNILLSTISKTIKPYFENDVLNMSREIVFDGMWININGKGNYNSSHNHPCCHMAGVFWINTPKNCGTFECQSPHNFNMAGEIMRYTEDFQMRTNSYPSWFFTPQEGKILIFPASLMHKVEANQSDENRISSSFNLLL